ncbi:ATP-binding protein [Deinococcus sp. HMF7604]|uniref:ATP-binding protein n=1 Tax=Deinococcus betulae TaxID=2873312 RepID=UPI001CC982E9|nr:ATP-binding protein [Deinococcus betulae]MBZ9752497.1 ATP-binding protein [Deinococcus betulae]
MTEIKLKGLTPRRNIHTLEGWRDFINAPRSYVVERASAEARAAWTEEQQRAYELARDKHHANLPVIVTPEVKHILGDIRLQLEANIHSSSTVCGAVLTGPATYGKSTALGEVGRQYELWFRRSYPPENPDHATMIIPVVKVGLSEKATTKSLNASIAHFYGVALSSRDRTRDEYQRIIRDRVALHHTKVIIIDDIHYLSRKARVGQANARHLDDKSLATLQSINNHIKTLADELGVTFIFGGINVDGTGLFDEGNMTDTYFSQVGGRMKRYELTGFPRGSAVWKSLVDTFEKQLLLDQHEPGTLVKLSDYLYQRTNGSIGSLTNMLKVASKLAILTKGERIDHELLREIVLDRNAEENFRLVMGQSGTI